MDDRRRRIVTRVLIVLLLVGLVGYGAFVGYVSWKSAQSLVHPARLTTDHWPDADGIAFENVTFTTDDGLTLAGWWMPSAGTNNTTAGTVVFLHGYGMSKNQSLMVAPFLVSAGYGVLAFDFRAHGDSDGGSTTVGLVEVADVQAAVTYVTTRPDADVTRLALFGFSMGAATGLNAAGDIASVRAIVADSSFATLTNIASNSITHFTGLSRYPYGPISVWMAGLIVGHDVGDNRPVNAISHLTMPVLIIQGAADNIARPASDGEALFDAAPLGSEFWLVPDATHVRAVEAAPSAYAERVLDFLARHLEVPA